MLCHWEQVVASGYDWRQTLVGMGLDARTGSGNAVATAVPENLPSLLSELEPGMCERTKKGLACLAALCAGAMALAMPASAAPVTLTFTEPDQVLAQNVAYVEAGFAVTPLDNDWTLFSESLTATVISEGDRASIVLQSGGLFRFSSFNYRSFGGLSDAVELLGRVGGSTVVTYGSFNATSTSTLLATFGDGTLVDEVLIRGDDSPGAGASILMDNFSFDTVSAVPVPAGLPLLLGGLGGLMLLRQRRRSA